MATKKFTELNVNCDDIVMTTDAAAHILIATIESIAFNRYQIPFPFNMFHQLIEKLESKPDSVEKSNWNDYLLLKQRNAAKDTWSAYKELFRNIITEFNETEVSEAIILLGCTVTTAKEAYHLRLPEVNRKHSASNHENSISRVRQSMFRILNTRDELLDKFSKSMHPTNLFVLLKKNKSTQLVEQGFKISGFSCLPNKCTKVFLNIIPKKSETIMNCCKDLVIFNDFQSLSIDNVKWHDNLSKIEDVQYDFIWYESKSVIKGYKETTIKGKTIWIS